MDVTDLLARAMDAGASDLHLAAGQIPMLRIEGDLQRMNLPALVPADLAEGMAPLLAEHQRRQWAQGDELDLALELPALGRFRLNLFRQLNGAGATFRLIPGRIATLDELDLGDVYQAVAQCTDGLILVGGPTGSGKSSTLATLIDQLNRERALHIITLEDPVEVIHSSQRSLINQREIGRHSGGFAQGLRSALRQDPDVIMIGELRDLESVRLALRAAETGTWCWRPCIRDRRPAALTGWWRCLLPRKSPWCGQCWPSRCAWWWRRYWSGVWAVGGWRRGKCWWRRRRCATWCGRGEWRSCVR